MPGVQNLVGEDIAFQLTGVGETGVETKGIIVDFETFSSEHVLLDVCQDNGEIVTIVVSYRQCAGITGIVARGYGPN